MTRHKNCVQGSGGPTSEDSAERRARRSLKLESFDAASNQTFRKLHKVLETKGLQSHKRTEGGGSLSPWGRGLR